MKKRTIILFMALSSLSVTSKAQWTVIDPTNLAQSIVNSANEIVQTSTTAQNMWSNFQETVKIYKQGKAYYDGAPVKAISQLVIKLQLNGEMKQIDTRIKSKLIE